MADQLYVTLVIRVPVENLTDAKAVAQAVRSKIADTPDASLAVSMSAQIELPQA